MYIAHLETYALLCSLFASIARANHDVGLGVVALCRHIVATSQTLGHGPHPMAHGSHDPPVCIVGAGFHCVILESGGRNPRPQYGLDSWDGAPAPDSEFHEARVTRGLDCYTPLFASGRIAHRALTEILAQRGRRARSSAVSRERP